MELNQFAAIFIATYFLCYPVLAWMMPNVPAKFRGNLWTTIEGWTIHMILLRALLGFVAVIVVALWTNYPLGFN